MPANIHEVDLLARALKVANKLPHGGPPLDDIDAVTLAAGAIAELERQGFVVSWPAPEGN